VTKQYNVYFRNEQTNRLCRYCVCSMPREVAEEYARKFNQRYIDVNGKGKRYPNRRGYYPYSKAWVDLH
jgi:hypothetical protein